MWAALMIIAAVLMIPTGLAQIVIGWKSRRSHGWVPVWGGATQLAAATVLLIPEDGLNALRYGAIAATVALGLASFVSMNRDAFRVYGLQLLLGGVAIAAIAMLELFALPSGFANVVVTVLVLVIAAFVVATSLQLFRALRMRQKAT